MKLSANRIGFLILGVIALVAVIVMGFAVVGVNRREAASVERAGQTFESMGLKRGE